MIGAGVDGGFDNNEPEYEETCSIVILPDFVSLPFPSVELPEKVGDFASECFGVFGFSLGEINSSHAYIFCFTLSGQAGC